MPAEDRQDAEGDVVAAGQDRVGVGPAGEDRLGPGLPRRRVVAARHDPHRQSRRRDGRAVGRDRALAARQPRRPGDHRDPAASRAHQVRDGRARRRGAVDVDRRDVGVPHPDRDHPAAQRPGQRGEQLPRRVDQDDAAHGAVAGQGRPLGARDPQRQPADGDPEPLRRAHPGAGGDHPGQVGAVQDVLAGARDRDDDPRPRAAGEGPRDRVDRVAERLRGGADALHGGGRHRPGAADHPRHRPAGDARGACHVLEGDRRRRVVSHEPSYHPPGPPGTPRRAGTALSAAACSSAGRPAACRRSGRSGSTAARCRRS